MLTDSEPFGIKDTKENKKESSDETSFEYQNDIFCERNCLIFLFSVKLLI